MSELPVDRTPGVAGAAGDAARGHVVYLTEHGERLAAIVPAEFAAALEGMSEQDARDLLEDLADAAAAREALPSRGSRFRGSRSGLRPGCSGRDLPDRVRASTASPIRRRTGLSTRLRTDLTRERTRYWQRLEKLLEDSLIKVSAVAGSLDTLSVRDMPEALIAGERDPKVLAGLARGRMKAKRGVLIEALTGRFDDHHAELTRMLLDQVDALTAQIARLTTRIGELIAAIPAAQGVDADGTTGPSAGHRPWGGGAACFRPAG